MHLRAGDGLSDAGTLWVDYATLVDDLAVDDRVVLGDGAISMRVTSNDGIKIEAIVETGGRTQGSPGVQPVVGSATARHTDR